MYMIIYTNVYRLSQIEAEANLIVSAFINFLKLERFMHVPQFRNTFYTYQP